MARDSNGTYTLEFGSPSNVQPGTTIQSSWANGTLDDIADALTNSLDRQGRGGMLAPFKFANGLEATPSITWSNEANTGFWRPGTVGDMRLSILGSDLMRWNNTQVQIWANSQWNDVVYAGGPGGMPNGSADFETLSWNNSTGAWVVTPFLSTNYTTGDVSIANNLTVLGDIFLSGNVDNRNVSADGATLDAHVANTSIHFADAVADGTQYARQDNGWVSVEATGETLPPGTADGQALRWETTGAAWGPSSIIVMHDSDDTITVSNTWVIDGGVYFGGFGATAVGVYETGGDLYHKGTENIFENGGGEIARFDATGALGIGTASPNASSALDVNGTIYTEGKPLLSGEGVKWIEVRTALPVTTDPNTLYFLTG